MKEYSDNFYSRSQEEKFDPMNWLDKWHRHMINLSIELFNSFVYGNLLTISAMTRALIECYVYVSILKKEKSPALIDEWYICNIIHKMNRSENEKYIDRLMCMLQDYCKQRDIDSEEKLVYYKNAKREGAWLRKLMGEKGVGFQALCTYIEQPLVYEDYQGASAYVHGQDITTKTEPFMEYSTIYDKLYLMMCYIFKTIRLFGADEELEAMMDELEMELFELGEKYLEIEEVDD